MDTQITASNPKTASVATISEAGMLGLTPLFSSARRLAAAQNDSPSRRRWSFCGRGLTSMKTRSMPPSSIAISPTMTSLPQESSIAATLWRCGLGPDVQAGPPGHHHDGEPGEWNEDDGQRDEVRGSDLIEIDGGEHVRREPWAAEPEGRESEELADDLQESGPVGLTPTGL